MRQDTPKDHIEVVTVFLKKAAKFHEIQLDSIEFSDDRMTVEVHFEEEQDPSLMLKFCAAVQNVMGCSINKLLLPKDPNKIIGKALPLFAEPDLYNLVYNDAEVYSNVSGFILYEARLGSLYNLIRTNALNHMDISTEDIIAHIPPVLKQCLPS